MSKSPLALPSGVRVQPGIEIMRSPSLFVLRALLAFAMLAAPRLALAVSITSAVCTQQVTNVLRYDCAVTTDAMAQVRIDLCEGTGCSFDRSSEVSFKALDHEVTVWNLRPETTYTWQARASDRFGTATDGPYTFTTASLLDSNGDGVDDAALSAMSVSTWFSSSEPATVDDVLFTFGCADSGAPESDQLIITDSDGTVVWYKSLRGLTGVAPSMSGGFTVDQRRHRIHVIVNHDYIYDLDMAGEVHHLFCRCDSAGLCPNGDTPDGCWDEDEYVHHEVLVKDGVLWALTAEEIPFTDTLDCDKDLATTTIDFMMDGVRAWRLDTGAPLVDWDMSEIYTPWRCGMLSYWSAVSDAEDWAHANSLWVDGDNHWTISNRYVSEVIQVEGDPTDPDFGQLIWEMAGDSTDTGDDWTVSSAASSPDFSWQHHAWFTRAGTMMLYDNNVTGSEDSRVLELALDESSMVAEVVAEYDTALRCMGQGGGFDIGPGGNMLVNCSDDTDTSSVIDATIMEFSVSTASTVWEMELGCDGTATPPGSRNGPQYRAMPFSFEH